MTNTISSAISLSRAISKRISNRDSHNPLTSLSNSIKSKRHSDMSIRKGLISSPVELISTTNTQLFSAPPVGTVRISTDIPQSPESAGSPPPLTPDKGYNLEYRHHGLPTPPSTPIDKTFSHYSSRHHSRSTSVASNLTDASYVSSRPQLPLRAARNSASSSSSSNSTTSNVSNMSSNTSNSSSGAPPPIPQRKSSSSSRKSSESSTGMYTFFPPPPKSHRRLNRSLSNGALRSAVNSQAAGMTNIIDNSGATANSTVKKYPGGLHHPFGKELAQVSELAEEMGLDLDEECMLQRGLHKFSAADYLAEVEEVVVVKGLFGRKASVKLGGAGWI